MTLGPPSWADRSTDLRSMRAARSEGRQGGRGGVDSGSVNARHSSCPDTGRCRGRRLYGCDRDNDQSWLSQLRPSPACRIGDPRGTLVRTGVAGRPQRSTPVDLVGSRRAPRSRASPPWQVDRTAVEKARAEQPMCIVKHLPGVRKPAVNAATRDGSVPAKDVAESPACRRRLETDPNRQWATRSAQARGAASTWCRASSAPPGNAHHDA